MIVVVSVDPPRPGFVLPAVVEGTTLTADEAASLYAAATRDVLAAVAPSGGELLVNYRDESTLPAAVAETDPEAEIRSLADDALGPADDVRFERQVGSTRSAR
ncbi:MAG: hypothetical protein ACQETI_13405, partial [Halobacteriota archaeon]